MPGVKKSPKRLGKGKGDKIKRPTSAYMYFMQTFRQTYEQEYGKPASKVTEVAKAGGEKWKSLTEEEKEPYLEKAAADKERYEEEKQLQESA